MCVCVCVCLAVWVPAALIRRVLDCLRSRTKAAVWRKWRLCSAVTHFIRAGCCPQQYIRHRRQSEKHNLTSARFIAEVLHRAPEWHFSTFCGFLENVWQENTSEVTISLAFFPPLCTHSHKGHSTGVSYRSFLSDNIQQNPNSKHLGWRKNIN